MSAVVNGSDVYAKISTDGGMSFTLIIASTEASVSIAHNPRDVTVKYDLGSRHLADGKREWNIDGSGWVAYDATTFTPADLASLLSGRTGVFVELVAGSESGAQSIIGQAYLTAKADEGGTEDTESYNVSLSGLNFFGDTWGEHLALRVADRGGTMESKSCVNSSIYDLKQVNIN